MSIPVLTLPLLKMDSYRLQCEKAYQRLGVFSLSTDTSANEQFIQSSLVHFIYITPTLFKIGSTHVDKVMLMYAICQVTSYRLKVYVRKQDVIRSITSSLCWTKEDVQEAVDLVSIMGNLCPNWVFLNQSVYMKQYLNNAGFV